MKMILTNLIIFYSFLLCKYKYFKYILNCVLNRYFFLKYFNYKNVCKINFYILYKKKEAINYYLI